MSLADQLIDTLPVGQPGLFNPWRDRCECDTPSNGPEQRRDRLRQHLACDRPRFILVGEAPGFQGCRFSGIAFTSERLLLEGAIPRISAPSMRLTTRKLPFSEPSATIVWKALYRFGIAEDTILWNAVQLHPFRPENRLKNRTPTPAEVALGAPALRLLLSGKPTAKVVAVGQKALAALSAIGIVPYAAIRHPANGGGPEFLEGLEAAVKQR